MTPVLRDPLNAPSQHEFFFHYCGKNVTAVRHRDLKIHFATQKWTSDARPTPKCVECCPYGPTTFGGHGGSMCDCGVDDLIMHDTPLIYNMTADKEERNPLTRMYTCPFQRLTIPLFLLLALIITVRLSLR